MEKELKTILENAWREKTTRGWVNYYDHTKCSSSILLDLSKLTLQSSQTTVRCFSDTGEFDIAAICLRRNCDVSAKLLMCTTKVLQKLSSLKTLTRGSAKDIVVIDHRTLNRIKRTTYLNPNAFSPFEIIKRCSQSHRLTYALSKPLDRYRRIAPDTAKNNSRDTTASIFYSEMY